MFVYKDMKCLFHQWNPLSLGRHNFQVSPSNQTIQAVMDVPRDNAQVLFGPHKKKSLLVHNFFWNPYVLSDQPSHPR